MKAFQMLVSSNTSAKSDFSLKFFFLLQTSNALRVAAINSVGTFVLLLGKLAVVIATVAVSYEIMRIKTETVYVAHPWAPILIAACFSYLTAHCFIAVYGMAIDTIFLCFCEDSARNDGITRPYYMSKVSYVVLWVEEIQGAFFHECDTYQNMQSKSQTPQLFASLFIIVMMMIRA